MTGGGGFIGNNFIRRLLENDKKSTIINLDAMLDASNYSNLKDLKDPRYTFIKGNICKIMKISFKKFI